MRAILIFILLTFITIAAYADDSTQVTDDYLYEVDYFYNENINWLRMFDIFFSSQQRLINHPMVSISVGRSFNSLPMNMPTIPNTVSYNFEYGFVRLDSNYRFPELRGYSSENIFIENSNNDYDLSYKMHNNTWNFGAGLTSGYGQRYENNEIYWLHNTSFIWSYPDYYNMSEDNSFFDKYDMEYKFGNKGVAAISYRIGKTICLDASYEHSNIYSDMEYGKWIGSWVTDLILQRWIDLLDPIFIRNMGYMYPVVRFIYKNAISIIFSEIRNSKQFFPFNSNYSLLDRRISLKLKLLF